MVINGTRTESNGAIVHYIEVTEGDLYLLGFAMETLRKYAASPQIEAGASELLRQIQTMI